MQAALKSTGPSRLLAQAMAAAGAVIAMATMISSAAADPKAASMVVDANSGAVLHNRAGDEKVYPASLTKMMTIYMAFELIELGRLSYDSKIKMTQEGADAAPSKLDLEPGEELTLLNAIKALVTKSANDVAIALAMHIGGTEANFARLMTSKARELGMPNTTFRNASGLPDPEQTTTARDM
ncbi:MAG: D-alanyl-D-alanine carboxypeptidase, partial [Hyphomicrobium sp.]|nr:D-alanyl-D-alanine carboxypeptidase [Hyphomicrobium sp.]